VLVKERWITNDEGKERRVMNVGGKERVVAKGVPSPGTGSGCWVGSVG
jgi:hypothetical protein